MSITLSELARILDGHGMTCVIEGDAERTISSVATLEEAGPDQIAFLANLKYEAALTTTRAGAVIVGETQAIPEGLTVLRTKDPYAAVTAVIVHVHGYRRHPAVGIDDRAVIHPSARIGEGANVHHGVTISENVVIGDGANIYPGCYIARDCRLGEGCTLYPNVTLYDGSILGHRVTLHAGTVIGEDGLGYAPIGETWHKIPQIGIVEIGDDVELGANCTIDRATLGRTVIGKGTKFSNLVAIGHGTKVGENCMFVAQVGVAGSVTIGKHVTMAGKVGVAGHLTVGDDAQLAAMTGVMRDVDAGAKVAGQPSIPFNDFMRCIAVYERLPEMHKQMRRMERKLAELEQALAARQKNG